MQVAKLFVALDTSDLDQAESWVSALAPLREQGLGLKLGYALLYSGGFSRARAWADAGWQLFFDLKLYDIPNTVRGAVEALAPYRPALLTVHAVGQVMHAAREARDALKLPTRLLGVTVLTSMSGEDLAQDGLNQSLAGQVLRRAHLAHATGLDGLVASALEAPELRNLWGGQGLIVTPGIRPSDAPLDDQQRAVTPAQAKALGASHLVVGRPITRALDPLASAAHMLDEFS